ncbi:unnamed protein product [Allacma fusca]|uniref:Uncharacterized protein n=1 Tax=Allacma fusca TaxID=39272 RepID=A0A8J2JMZ7_9HEXA|nr:unnamed protein product [Allacma fusca]
MMDILLRLEKNSATHSASLASLEGTVKSSKLTLDNLSKDVKAIRDTIGNHAKRIDSLEKKAEKSDVTQSRQSAEIIHLKNDLMQLKNGPNSSFCIIAGVSIHKDGGRDIVLSSIQSVLNLTGLVSTDIDDVSTGPRVRDSS